MSNKKIDVQSHKGVYTVNFIRGGMDQLNSNPIENAIYIFDKKIATIYRQQFKSILDTQRVILIEAKEENKSLDKFSNYVGNLVDYKLRRGQTLIAIGGGIIQDITCFLAATVMRGLPWIFFPTTLLAQSDSCIGSKSSINCGDLKNILGTFTPPNKIIIDAKFLQTLEQKDIHSGIGEMLKVHAINSPKSFDLISSSILESVLSFMLVRLNELIDLIVSPDIEIITSLMLILASFSSLSIKYSKSFLNFSLSTIVPHSMLSVLIV